jgi:serine/threonine protein kinase
VALSGGTCLGAALARFQREAKVVAALSHPNILAIHDFGRAPDGPGETVEYAVMELLEDETLRKKWKRARYRRGKLARREPAAAA